MEEINNIINNKTPTGSRILDEMLNGGYENDVITTIYGPAGAGKTVICILAAMTAVKNGKKVIYVDSEGGFSVERLKQVASGINDDYKEILNGMIFLRPTTFEEQKKSFEKLKDIVNDKIRIIIVDSIAMLYRLALGKSDDFQEVNRELGRQIGYLTEIARKKNIPVLITNQVYMDFDEKDKVNIVGGDILKYGSKSLIELQITPDGNRRLIIRKHRNIQAERELLFKIVEAGITSTKESKGFKLF